MSCRGAIAASERVRIDRIVHIRQPPIAPDHRYYIIAREPIARAVSAFNWRMKLVVRDALQPTRFPGERNILETYGTLNALSEALYFTDGSDNVLAQGNFRSIHHLGESISFYLTDLLAGVAPEQIGGVIMQETLDRDLRAIFGVETEAVIHENRSVTSQDEMFLSPKARANLTRYLRDDFRCLEVLRAWGKLDDTRCAEAG